MRYVKNEENSFSVILFYIAQYYYIVYKPRNYQIKKILNDKIFLMFIKIEYINDTNTYKTKSTKIFRRIIRQEGNKSYWFTYY